MQVFILRGLKELPMHAPASPDSEHAENDETRKKETDRRDNKAGEEETGATSIYKDIILVYVSQGLLLDGLFEREGKFERGRIPYGFSTCRFDALRMRAALSNSAYCYGFPIGVGSIGIP